VNAAGESEASAAAAVTPAASRVPGPVSRVEVGTPANGTARIPGGHPPTPATGPVTGYTVTATPGGRTVTTATTSATMGGGVGLDPLTAYSFTVRSGDRRRRSGRGREPTGAIRPKVVVTHPPVVLSARRDRRAAGRYKTGLWSSRTRPPRVTGLTPGTFVLIERSEFTPSGFLGEVTAKETRGGRFLSPPPPAALNDLISDGGFRGSTAAWTPTSWTSTPTPRRASAWPGRTRGPTRPLWFSCAATPW